MNRVSAARRTSHVKPGRHAAPSRPGALTSSAGRSVSTRRSLAHPNRERHASTRPVLSFFPKDLTGLQRLPCYSAALTDCPPVPRRIQCHSSCASASWCCSLHFRMQERMHNRHHSPCTSRVTAAPPPPPTARPHSPPPASLSLRPAPLPPCAALGTPGCRSARTIGPLRPVPRG